MKYKGIKIEEISLQISDYKEEINGESGYDYFCEQLEDVLEEDAYLEEIDSDITSIRFEKDTSKETLEYIIKFYDKYIRDNKKILDHCCVELGLDLDEFITDEDGDTYNFAEIKIDNLNIKDISY
ncbi:spore photoproduct [Clostridium perfringens]|uniref:spore photoproduct n=1 Tax=Clostridium perfringens TaxID=1502 RepID=UPI003748B643